MCKIRSSTYYALSASLLTTKLLGMTLGTFLLQRGMWIPPQVGLLILTLGIPTLFFLPDSATVSETGSSREALLAAAKTPTNREEVSLWSSCRVYLVAQFRAVTVDYFKSFRIVIDLLVHDKLSRMCMTIFLFNVVGMGVRIVLQQWASTFFHWTLVKTSYVLSFELLVNGLVLVSLPFISQRVLKPRLGSTRQADIWVAKVSLIMNIIGALCIGFAPTGVLFVVALTVYSAGAGLYDALKSFATGLLRKEEITRLYVGISMVETVGGLIGGPLWSGVFSLALCVDFLGTGLPFWMCSLCFIGAFVSVLHLERHLKTITLPMAW